MRNIDMGSKWISALRGPLLGVVVLLGVAGAAGKSGAVGAEAAVPVAGATDPGKPVSFKADLQPILDENCVACHQTGAAQQGLILEDGRAFAAIVNVPSREAKMALVTPGAPDSSYLLHKLEGSHLGVGGTGARMPLGLPIDAAKAMAVRKWIEEGAKDN